MSVPLYLNHDRKSVYYIGNNVLTKSGIGYEIQERINSGGNAVVHKCQNERTGDDYAIKFNLSFAPRRLQRFQQEINLIKDITHDQLITYIDDGSIKASYGKNKRQERDALFLIMPVADTNLRQYISRKGTLSYKEYISQFKGLTSALYALHQKAIHRDIKPENILIKGDTWFLSDLGLCKYTEGDGDDISLEHEVIGPRYWMSPEAINKMLGNTDVISDRSDIFQLASIFWYVVTGRHPIGVVSKDDWNGPVNIFEPIFRSLSHNPDNRISNAQELLNNLEDATFK